MRARATRGEHVERVRYLAALVAEGMEPSQAIKKAAQTFSVSVRQARRYLQQTDGLGVTVILRPVVRHTVEQAPPPPRLGACYVLQHRETGLIKIGCSQNWKARKTALKVGSEKCHLLALWQDDQFRERERDLQAKLAQYRLPGSEWFFCTPEQVLDAS